MRYVIILSLIIVGCLFILVPKVTGSNHDKIAIVTETVAEKQNIETAATATVKYFKKYKQNLKDEIKIVSINQQSSYATLVNKYGLNASQAELLSAGRGFYTGNTVFINMQIANNPVMQVSTVAHELTHHYQKQLINSVDSLIWLQEGMAELTAGDILEEAGQTVPQTIKISKLNLPADLDLSKLRTNDDWLQSVQNYGADAVYIYSSIAVRELVARTSYWSLIEFHHELSNNKNITKSFKKAFRIELADFERELSNNMKDANSSLLYYKYY